MISASLSRKSCLIRRSATLIGNNQMTTALIAGNSLTGTISSQALETTKVQRLDRKIVDPSGSKWAASHVDGDIVSSAW